MNNKNAQTRKLNLQNIFVKPVKKIDLTGTSLLPRYEM